MDTPPPPVLGTFPSKEERSWAMIAHLSAFAGHVFPFAHIIAPLIVWQYKKDLSSFVDEQGKESVNAQISVTLYGAVAVVLCFILIGIPLVAGLYIANFALVIIAGLAANDGKPYRYPFILRLVK